MVVHAPDVVGGDAIGQTGAPDTEEISMANAEHLEILKQGSMVWNKWRQKHYMDTPDLSGVDLSGANLAGASLSRVSFARSNLRGSCLKGAILLGGLLNYADLRGADLREAKLEYAELNNTNLEAADLRGANLFQAMFIEAKLGHSRLDGASLRLARVFDTDLTAATMVGVDLLGASLINVCLEGAVLTDCNVYGVSAWGLGLESVKEQNNLRITPDDEPEITVDNLEVAQFLYLMLHNEKIRGVIDTIGKKGVLILGRFTSERKPVLDAIRKRLRELGYVPILFDFEKPTQRDFTETIKTLAGMSRFIIADITNPKSSPLELQATVPEYMVPFIPILDQEEQPFSMFMDLQNKFGGEGGWVLDLLKYDTAENLVGVLEQAVVRPALEKADQLLLRKAEAIRERHVSDYADV